MTQNRVKSKKKSNSILPMKTEQDDSITSIATIILNFSPES